MKRDEFYIGCRRENEWECLTPMDRVIYMRDEYVKYWEKIKTGENFAFLRYGDGELALMTGCEVTAQEGWHAGRELTGLGRKLRETLTPISERMIYGIPCPCCHSRGYYWYLNHLENSVKSFANIWINGNFQMFMRDFSALERDAVMITNQAGIGKSYGNLRIRNHYAVSDDCVTFWENECEALIERIASETGKEDGLFYAVSAGPLSEIIIWELFKRNPRNCYVDFGSALDLFIHDRITRPFMTESSPYAKKNCWMFAPKFVQTDIDIVLTTYKRPEALGRQLEAIHNQTLKPRRVLLYQDGTDSYYSIRLHDEILKQFDDYFVSNTNDGVWKRFEYAKDVIRAKYVCIFDDDTIPGERWLENCHMNMMQHRGVYGTNGILLSNLEYPYGGGGIHIGWHAPNKKTEEADFVGHSWFLETEWLEWMFSGNYQDRYKYVGEDMCLSFMCKKRGIKTYVPAHPEDIPSLWGSIPKYGNAYGVTAVAVHMNHNNMLMMNDALRQYCSDGWHPIVEEDEGYIAKRRLHERWQWYSSNPSIEKDDKLECLIIDSMKKFREAKQRYHVYEMAVSLLAAKPVVVLLSMKESTERREFFQYFFSVFFLGMIYAIQQGNHSLSLVFLVAIEEVLLTTGGVEPAELEYYKGIVYYFRREYISAENHFVAYLSKFPRNEEAFFYIGNAAAKQNVLERAIEAYNHALSIKKNYREIAHNLETIVSAIEKERQTPVKANEFEDDSRRCSLSFDEENFGDLPVFIRVKNQLSGLDNLLTWLLSAGHRNIYILDCKPLQEDSLEYYDNFSNSQIIHVLFMKRDLGHEALWRSNILNVLHVSTPYVYIESNHLPIDECPKSVVQILLQILKKYPFLTRVGLGLNMELEQQQQEEELQLEKNVYFGAGKTKFAVYRNCYHDDNFSVAYTGGALTTVCQAI